MSKQTLAIEYHVYIWQVLPQLSCGDTCQIWMWFRESNRYFRNIENFAYGEISERSFSNPHTWLILGLRPANERRCYKCSAVSHWLGANLESALKYACPWGQNIGCQRPLLLTWFNFNPSIDKSLCPLWSLRWNYLSIPKLQRLDHWSLGMDK